MHIITDDILFSRQLLHEIDDFLPVIDTSKLPISNELVKNIYHENDVYAGTVQNLSGWNCICIVNHASKSYLHVISEMLAKNVEIPDSLVIVARKGDGFIGHKSRKWIADDGNLHVTFFLKPQMPITHVATAFTIIAVVSILQTLDQIPELEDKSVIRWVNDILVDNKKIAGVLCRTQMQGTIVENASIGLGINVNTKPDVIPDMFVPLVNHVSAYSQNSLNKIFENLLINLYTNYKLLVNGKYNDLWQFYNDRSMIINKRIAVYSDPDTGKPELLQEGKVERIGHNLEIYLQGTSNPITSGRLVLI